MSEPNPKPDYYSLFLRQVVEEELDALDDLAYAAGHYDAFAAALDKLYEILRVYPQHGEPLHDIEIEGKTYTSRMLTVPPLAVQYVD